MGKYKKDFIVLSIIIVINCFLTYFLEREPNWDFYSYHFFNGWAFFNDRLNIDFMPCSIRSYFNPLMDAVMYFLIDRLNNHPLLFIMISGLKYSILMFVSFKLYEFFFEKFDKFNKNLSIIFCLLFAGSSPIILFGLNFDNTDIPYAILILVALYIYMDNIFKNSSKQRYCYIFFSSLLIGVAIALKYVCVVYSIAIILTTLCLIKKIQKPFKTIGVSILGQIDGFLIAGGWWFATIWNKFGNPLFPYFNNIFKSPFSDADLILNEDFDYATAKSVLGYIFSPIRDIIFGLPPDTSQPEFDLKLPLTFILIILMVIILFNKKTRKETNKVININYLYFLIIFIAISYYANSYLFAVTRYIMILFILAPIVLCVFATICLKKEFYIYPLIIVFCFYCFSYECQSDIGLTPYKKSISKVVTPVDYHFEDGSTVICSMMAACYPAPFQNPNVKYVGFTLPKHLSELTFWAKVDRGMLYTNKYLEQQVKKILAEDNNIYFIYVEDSLGIDGEDLVLYQKALSMYSDEKLSIDNCDQVSYIVMGHETFTYQVCKIKTKSDNQAPQ